MKIHEYQAKALMAEFGIPVPRGGLATAPAQARARAQELGGKVVLKAQVYAGGRGKAGGIRVANSPEEAENLAGQMLGTRLVTHQTGPEGVPLSKLLVEEALDIHKELYLSILVDGCRRMPVMMASEAGGVDIEEVARISPERIVRSYIDPVIGFQPFMARRLAYGMNLPGELVRPATQLMANLYKLFMAKDCSLAEINPLVITVDGRLLALDAKLNFDDSGLFRHPEIRELRDTEQEEPLEVEASNQNVSYIKLDGDVGCMVNGAGLAMATMDIVKLYGAEPANFLDVGGGANEQQVAAALKIILNDPKVKRVLINIFGGILRCDVAARGIVAAAMETQVKVPMVVRMRGTNVDEGRQILAESGMNIILASDLRDAAQKVAAARI
ncbi:MAG TPA: ADP-forming succinate--CoA ligase subunit beta [Dehalococcoidia bacterium]|nr:ADP-forming succinate--CoA ligase subunit beta [Dehalococcoidia bacterium]